MKYLEAIKPNNCSSIVFEDRFYTEYEIQKMLDQCCISYSCATTLMDFPNFISDIYFSNGFREEFLCEVQDSTDEAMKYLCTLKDCFSDPEKFKEAVAAGYIKEYRED